MARPSKKVKKESPFYGLKSYYNLFPFFEDFDEWDEKVEGRPLPDGSELWPDPGILKESHPAWKYVQGESHDAYIRNVRWEGEILEIELQDVGLLRLGSVYEERFPRRKDLDFRVTWRFEGVRELRLWHPHENGELRGVRHSLRSGLRKASEYMSDRFLRWDDEGIVAVFRWYKQYKFPKGVSFSRHSHEMVLGVDALVWEVVETQREQWRECYGNDALPVFDRFHELRGKQGHEGISWFYRFLDKEFGFGFSLEDDYRLRLRKPYPIDAFYMAKIHHESRRQAMPFLPELHSVEETREWLSRFVFQGEKVRIATILGGGVGYVSMKDGWLNNLYVDPVYQGMGVGSRLFEWAREQMPDGFQFWVFQENHRARACYEARGCRLVKLTDGADNEEKTPDALYEWKPDL